MSKLYIVPTPIGNLEDITLRAIRILGEVDLVIAEDTRVSLFLLKHLGIQKPVVSHHKFNEHRNLGEMVNRINNCNSVALVSDAGTPSISDPGFMLVRRCAEEGIDIECLPGPTAFVPALVNSALPCDRFVFEGFLPLKKGRKTKLEMLAKDDRTVILYESPMRLARTLNDLITYFGAGRKAAIVRELTKLHEETRRATLDELLAHYTTKPPKGEIVIVLDGYNQ